MGGVCLYAYLGFVGFNGQEWGVVRVYSLFRCAKKDEVRVLLGWDGIWGRCYGSSMEWIG